MARCSCTQVRSGLLLEISGERLGTLPRRDTGRAVVRFRSRVCNVTIVRRVFGARKSRTRRAGIPHIRKVASLWASYSKAHTVADTSTCVGWRPPRSMASTRSRTRELYHVVSSRSVRGIARSRVFSSRAMPHALLHRWQNHISISSRSMRTFASWTGLSPSQAAQMMCGVSRAGGSWLGRGMRSSVARVPTGMCRAQTHSGVVPRSKRRSPGRRHPRREQDIRLGGGLCTKCQLVMWIVGMRARFPARLTNVVAFGATSPTTQRIVIPRRVSDVSQISQSWGLPSGIVIFRAVVLWFNSLYTKGFGVLY